MRWFGTECKANVKGKGQTNKKKLFILTSWRDE